ncbi:2-keto-4-pentenoate hydratase [Paraburkholderia caribensis]|uniref:2-keto-4-pentenoate hydratase n=1 Tax=Paraburkholderia caribensis TaxID=75105 RepID=UPI001CB2CCDA|nr:fumarylacetoacetate hydrolase family protein [Paraburkholderia caribensis]CAG9263064.1 2-hydroxypentadienoate hydratase [Paraburkholderia caribensis]
MTARDAYEVQQFNTHRLLADGHRLVGRKIGLTSHAVQSQLGVSEPDYGMLWADGAVDADGSASIGSFIAPKIEAEVGFVMGRDLVDEGLVMHDVLSAVEYALPALEIVDSAIKNWDIRLIDTIADNASGGGYVLGTSPRRIDDLDLRMVGMVLSCGGLPVSLGVGAACLGHPLTALLWLARKMVEVGEPLRAGELVLSGALGPMVPVRANEDYLLEIQGFAPVGVHFVQ